MKKTSRIMSALLAVIMAAGCFTVAASASIPLLPSKEDPSITDFLDTINVYLGETSKLNNDKNKNKQVVYNTPQEKLAGMADKPMWENHGYQLWVDEVTGEVATVKTSTGEILFTNPWNAQSASFQFGSTKKTTSLAIKQQLLSQIVVNYIDNDTDKTFYSCLDAATKDQISVEYISNGIRVEYSIGDEETRMLVPKLISKERFENKILKPMRELINTEIQTTVSDGSVRDPITGKTVISNRADFPIGDLGVAYNHYELVKLNKPDFDMSGPLDLKYDQFQVKKVASYYQEKNAETAPTDRERSEIMSAFPITKKMAVYVFDPSATNVEMKQVERRIKEYCPSYTFEDLDRDHEETEYVGTDKQPALFKMAIEYTLDENGLCVRQPANGIRFDQSLYQLESFELLPYMGAGASDGDLNDGGDGYTFFPDGSGALFDFDLVNNGSNRTINGKVYGQDFAYHNISGTNQEIIRYPAFGIVEKWEGKKTVPDYDKLLDDAKYDTNGKLISEAKYDKKIENVKEDRGFLAIIEEGDALAELSTYHMGATSIYNTVRMIFYPRPKDEYNMADAISVGSNTKMTVVSERKYVGSYRVRYIMLTDDKLAEENKLPNYYECSWMGMAVAYRDYLEKTGVLTRLQAADVDDDIPLYIETFGAVWTTEKILSIPVDVMTPLTSFEDISTIYTELSSAIENSMKQKNDSDSKVGTTDASAESFSNINFKLTGYANGGMYSTVPYHLNWEAAVGGASGFRELVEESKQAGFDLFPDFDFVYINSEDFFDGVDLKRDAVKTIDNRYTGRRRYSATSQAYQGYFGLAIAPSCFDRFVTKLTDNYLKYDPTGISVSTFGTDLNSDFDEEDPLNREDSKSYTIQALKKLSELKNKDGNRIKVMTDGGNAYTWKYVDYIVNMPLNSSRYNISSNAVPFIGVVLHGYKQFAGTPINEEGDIEFAFLKAIENGASIYFTLSYRNTDKLKEFTELSHHFSVRYDIWKEDVVDMYVKLNDLLCDLQTKLIIDHDFLIGSRVPDEDEVDADKEEEKRIADLEKANKNIEDTKKALKEALDLRHQPTASIEKIESAIKSTAEQVKTLTKYIAKLNPTYVNECEVLLGTVTELEAELKTDKFTTFSPKALSAAYEAADKYLRENLVVLATKSVDDIINNGTAADKAEADKVQKTLLNAAYAVANTKLVKAAEEMAEAGTNYTSTAAKTNDAASRAIGIINGVREELAARTAELNTESSNKTLTANLCNVITADMLAALEGGMATQALLETDNAYSLAVRLSEADLNLAINSAVELFELLEAAVKNGANRANLEAAVAKYRELENLSQRITAVNDVKNATKRFVNDYSSALNSYISSIASYIGVADLGGASEAVKNGMVTYNNLISYKISREFYASLITNPDPTKDEYYTSLSSAEAGEASMQTSFDALAPEVKADVIAKYIAIVGTVDALVNNAGTVYAELKAISKEKFDIRESVILEKIASLTIYDEEDKEAVANAAKLINEKKRYTDILNIAKYYLDTFEVNHSSRVMAEKEYAGAQVMINELNASIDALDANARKRAELQEKICDGNIKEKTAEVEARYKVKDLYIKAVFNTNYFNNTYAVNAGTTVSAYKAALSTLDTLEAQKAAIEAFVADENNENSLKALNAATLAYNTAKNDFDAKSTAVKSGEVAKLIDEIRKVQTEFDKAEATKNAAEAIAIPHPNATSAEISAYSTAAEISDYEAKFKAFTEKQAELAEANAQLAAAKTKANNNTEFDALVNAYNAYMDAKEDNTEIKKVFDAARTAESDKFMLDASFATLLNKAITAGEKRATLNAKLVGSESYDVYVNKVKNSFSSIQSYYETAERDYNNAKNASDALNARVESTKLEFAEAEWMAKIYEAAVLLVNYSVSELKAFAAAESGETKFFRIAYAAVTENIADLEAKANADADKKSEAALTYAVAEAYEKHSREGLIALNESYQSKLKSASREMENAANFASVASAEALNAKSSFDQLKSKYDECRAAYDSLNVLKSTTLLFGNKQLDDMLASSLTDIVLANDLYDEVIKSMAVAEREWAIVKAEGEKYKAAKAEYDKLMALSESEQKQKAAEIEEYAQKLEKAGTALEAAKTVLINEHLNVFRDKFSQLTRVIDTSLFSKENQAKAEYDNAEVFYQKAKAAHDAATAAEKPAAKAVMDDAEAFRDRAKAIYEMIEANNNKFKDNDPAKQSEYQLLCEKARVDYGFLVFKDEAAEVKEYICPSNVAMLTDYVDGVYGIVSENVASENVNKYTCNDGSIVSVTYGGKNGNDADPYRTFILNFNSFTVTVNYGGTDYTIESYGYYVIDHNKEGGAGE